jgi:excisionase family DNA binding protein
MKKINISLAILSIILITSNTFLLYSLNTRFGTMNSRLDQLEMQLAGFRSSANSQNRIQQKNDTKEKEVFTPTELAEYMNISLDQVYDLIDAPGVGLPYINVGGEYRFGKEAIDDWLKGHKQ